MFARISNSWELVKGSYSVLRADKELVIYPILSGIATLLVTATFALPMIFAGLLDSAFSGRGLDLDIFSFVVAFLFYVVQYFIVTFSNSALVGAALIRLRGGDPTVGDGFRIAWSRIGIILGYTLIASTVGMILRSLSQRGKGLGRIAVGLIGLAWNLATFLAVPVLVVEGVGPFEAVKRSALLLKKTWGEQIVGNLSIGLIFGLLIFGSFVVVLVPAIAVTVMLETPWIMVAAVIILIVTITLLGLLSSTLSGIYSAAVYRYAAEGETGGYFSTDVVRGAFRSA